MGLEKPDEGEVIFQGVRIDSLSEQACVRCARVFRWCFRTADRA